MRRAPAASAAASTFSSRLRCLMPASAGFSPSLMVAMRRATPSTRAASARRRVPQRNDAPRCLIALRGVPAPLRTAPRHDDLEDRERRAPSPPLRRSPRASTARDANGNAEARATQRQPRQVRVEEARAPRAHEHGFEQPIAVLQPAIVGRQSCAGHAVDPGAQRGAHSLQLRSFAERAQQAARLGARFLEFALRDGIRDDARAGAQLDRVAAHGQRADQDVEVRVTIGAQPPQRTGIGAPPLAFQRRDDLHATHFRDIR